MHRSVHALTSRMSAMIQEREVRAQIAAVLGKEISIVDFARWIMSNSWNMHQDSDAASVDLVSDVHLLLAERDDFSMDDNGFLRALSALLNNVVLSAPIDIPVEQQRSASVRFGVNSANRWVPVGPVAA